MKMTPLRAERAPMICASSRPNHEITPLSVIRTNSAWLQKLGANLAPIALGLTVGICSPHLALADTANPDARVTSSPSVIATVAAAPTTATITASAPTTVPVDDDHPIIDLAKIIPADRLKGLETQFKALERDTGYRLRLLSSYRDNPARPPVEELRKGWHVDDKTVVVIVVPDNPNIMSFRYGLAVQQALSRPFFTELQSRYGNLFYIRDNGEIKAVDNAVGTLVGCLRNPNGCVVVPGLTTEHYAATLGAAVAGGFILGSVLRLDPQGFVQRRWIWGVVFFPLWGTLTINFGLGPVITRTADPLPVVANLAAAAAVAALVYFYPQAARAAGLTVDEEPSD